MGKRSPIEFSIPGEPVAKGRPRFARAGKFVRTFTPQKSARFEERVRLCAMNAGVQPFDGPVGVTVRAYWPARKPALKRGKRPAEWKDTRPDLDNCLKAVLDGLNGVGFTDDGQVASALIQKMRAAQGEAARTEVVLVSLVEKPND